MSTVLEHRQEFLQHRPSKPGVVGSIPASPTSRIPSVPTHNLLRSEPLERTANSRPSRKVYLRDYQRAWIANRRKAWLAGKSCEHCGSPERLEIHHLDPSQKITHAVWSWAKPRREAELAKCAVLCHGCHVEETRRQRVAASKYGNPIPGVHFIPSRNRWEVRQLGASRKFRGYFKTAEEAVAAAQALQ